MAGEEQHRDLVDVKTALVGVQAKLEALSDRIEFGDRQATQVANFIGERLIGHQTASEKHQADTTRTLANIGERLGAIEQTQAAWAEIQRGVLEDVKALQAEAEHQKKFRYALPISVVGAFASAAAVVLSAVYGRGN